MDDFRRITYGVLIAFIVVIMGWVSFVTFSGCGFSLSCSGAVPTAEYTSIPTLVPGTLPAVNLQLGAASVASESTATPSGQGPAQVARPSNPGGPGQAVSLTGDAASGAQIFSANCQVCHGSEGKGGNPNPGSTDGTIPGLNPIDPTLISSDHTTYATNLDLFIEHGSTPEGNNPAFSMPAWGDSKQLAPQQIADVIAYLISLNPAPPPGSETPVAAAPTPKEPEPTEEVARPSNPGGPGQAVSLTGDAASGAKIFAANCQVCHNTEGKGGNPNPGSADGTIPALNPIDPTLLNADHTTYVTNLDLFIEHGSTPEGTNPAFSMPAWGDSKQLASQQIADVIAYLISLNPPPAPVTQTAATAAPSGQEPEPTEEVAKPSNPGGPGQAMSLTGDATSGATIFTANCQVCHNTQGKGGNPNPGSADGTIPPLNPIDPTLKSPDYKTFATNLDLFVEHGSTPEGNNPAFSMPPWGDSGQLTPQQIADVIAYVISLNK